VSGCLCGTGEFPRDVVHMVAHWEVAGVQCKKVTRSTFDPSRTNFFIYFFYHNFAKIYVPTQIFQNYTSAVVARGVGT
jgi:hypothetical protein